MKIIIVQVNELEVPDSRNEIDAIHDMERFYEQCWHCPDRITKEIKVVHEVDRNSYGP